MSTSFRVVLACSSLVWGAFAIGTAKSHAQQTAFKDLPERSVAPEYAPGPVNNPLKGLVPYARPTPDRFPHSMEFGYLGFGELVVGPNEYRWDKLEALLDDVASRKHQTIFRIYLEYPGKSGVIPKFLVERGLKVHRYLNTNTQPFPSKKIETPDYESEVLRKEIAHFIASLGKKYDGDPRIAYVTAGILGTWGEWHTYPREDLWASKAVQREVLDSYQAAFSKTPVLLRYPAGKDDWSYAENHDRPFGYHDDSFCFATVHTGTEENDWFFESKLKEAGVTNKWRRHPIGGEIRPESWGCCFDSPPCVPDGQDFVACLKATHATWLMDTGMFREKADDGRYQQAMKLVRKLGYEFTVRNCTLKLEDSKLSVTLQIKNTGSAPFYHPGWDFEFALCDSSGKVLARSKGSAALHELPFDELGTVRSALALPNSTAEKTFGNYRLLVRIPNRLPGGPPVKFANRAQDADVDGWLTLCEL
ncbi:MAG: DUF4832 domain-containing protein [Pirellulaceae bacterium]